MGFLILKDLRQAGIKVWIDEAEIETGQSITEKIEKGIEGSVYLAVLLSPSSMNSKWVQTELKAGIQLEISGSGLTVLPLLIKDCKIPLFLRDKLYGDFRDPFSYTQNIVALIRQLSGKIDNQSKFSILLKLLLSESIIIIRDIILVNLISGLVGLILGLAGIVWYQTVASFAQLIYLTLGLFIVGVITTRNTWSHLVIVVFGIWLTNGIYLIPKGDVFGWFLNFLGMAGIMLIVTLMLLVFNGIRKIFQIN